MRLAAILGLVLAAGALAATKAELRRRYPTLEAAAHHFGVPDVNYAIDHHLIVTLGYPPGPYGAGGMVDPAEQIGGIDPMDLSIDYVRTHSGMTLDLSGSERPDITVWDDPILKVSHGRHRFPVGVARDDLTVEIRPELMDAFPGHYVYIPALDAVFESPWNAPRVAYTKVVLRRAFARGHSARIRLASGGTRSVRVDCVEHLDDSRRFLTFEWGKRGLIVGEMFPFTNPQTMGRERHFYQDFFPLDRKPEFALFNEIGAPELRDRPIEPALPTIIYGVRLYTRYLSGWDQRGPIFRDLGPAAPTRTASPPPGGAAGKTAPATGGKPAGGDAGKGPSPAPSGAPGDGAGHS